MTDDAPPAGGWRPGTDGSGDAAGGCDDDGASTGGGHGRGHEGTERLAVGDDAAAPETVRVPRGDLRRSRVVDDVGETLAAALDAALTGYVVVEPGGSVLLDGDARGVLTFADGVPVVAYCDATDRGGVDALADLAEPGPCAVEWYALPAAALEPVHDAPPLSVPPGAPAEELAADPDLAERTRAVAPDSRREPDGEGSALESFLADEERVSAIQEAARAEARERAERWGLDDQLT